MLAFQPLVSVLPFPFREPSRTFPDCSLFTKVFREAFLPFLFAFPEPSQDLPRLRASVMGPFLIILGCVSVEMNSHSIRLLFKQGVMAEDICEALFTCLSDWRGAS